MKALVTIALTAAVALSVNFAALAYTAEDLTACGADARRFCQVSEMLQALTGNYHGIYTCFHREHAKLSHACRARYRKPRR